VLVLGESGTGKELVARILHVLSDRAAGPFVVVNCAAIPENLLESELFGIEHGTATGVSGRKGKFELAHGGTVFLDEIGDMGLNLQAKILRLLQEKALTREAVAHMRLFISGSAPLSPETFAEFRSRTGQTILERYGMTEGGMFTSNPLEGERRGGTVGFPLPGTELRVVGENDAPLPAGEVGHIQVRGDNVFAGYWQMPEKTREEFTPEGYFRTGDMGRFDADGYLAIIGRNKDLIISGGLNVYPKEIEEAIDALPGVAESAVIGLPHPDFGEAVTAVVVRAKDSAGLTAEGILAALKANIAGFKVPKAVHFVDDLPRNAMGKVQKNILRSRYGDG